jgi:hypothetical protein
MIYGAKSAWEHNEKYPLCISARFDASGPENLGNYDKKKLSGMLYFANPAQWVVESN